MQQRYFCNVRKIRLGNFHDLDRLLGKSSQKSLKFLTIWWRFIPTTNCVAPFSYLFNRRKKFGANLQDGNKSYSTWSSMKNVYSPPRNTTGITQDPSIPPDYPKFHHPEPKHLNNPTLSRTLSLNSLILQFHNTLSFHNQSMYHDSWFVNIGTGTLCNWYVLYGIISESTNIGN